MKIKIEPSWKDLLAEEFDKEYFQKLRDFVRNEYLHFAIFPKPQEVFRAFNLTPVEKVKVVILGQDPYHTPGKANGLAFAVNPGESLPPSLKNIYKEINSDIGKVKDQSGDLIYWAEQGVLLLNATLTVKSGQAGSHQSKGWEQFTDAAISQLAARRSNLVFILWGSYAQKKAEFIDSKKHLVLKSPHPSPFSADRGFFGNKHFSKANQWLVEHGEKPVEW